LVHEQLLKRPLLNVPRLILLEMVNILHRTRKDGAFRLLAGPVRNDATKFIYPFVDVPAPSALDFFLGRKSTT
jgi:hypothetical protein